MKNKIVELSKNYNSLEISRLLNVALNLVEATLIDYYYQDTWKVSKEDLLIAASRVYFDSPVIISGELEISEPTLKQYLSKCMLYNNKRGRIDKNKSVSEKDICEDYQNCLSIAQLCTKYRLSKKSVCDILYKNEMSTDKVTFDDHLFDKIDSEEKAYWLGFMYADGGLNSGERNNGMEIALKLMDTEHLFKAKTFFNSKREVRIQYKGTCRCRLTLYSKYFKERLIKLGCISQKSLILKFPTEDQVPKQFIIPFIRGYFDGDGVLSYNISNKRNKDKILIVPNTGMLGTEDFLKGVFKYLPELKNTTLFQANRNGDSRCLQVSWAKEDSIYVMNTLYKDATIYLNRKYKRYLFFKNNNFAVLRSDFKDNDRAISVKAKQFINQTYNINIDELLQANTEITGETKESLVS